MFVFFFDGVVIWALSWEDKKSGNDYYARFGKQKEDKLIFYNS